jgi:hypothetical protein
MTPTLSLTAAVGGIMIIVVPITRFAVEAMFNLLGI